MRFALTDEHRELANAAREMFAKECPPAVARVGDVARVWPSITALGVFGDPDFGMVETAVLMDEAGYAAVPGPLAETFASLHVVDEAARSRITDGSVITAAAPYAAYCDIADAVLVADGLREVTSSPVASVDPARPLFSVDADPVSGPAYDVGALATAAYLTGMGRAMVDQAVAYAKAREQFGRPIGSFQAVKHRLADAYIAVEFARPVVTAAAWSMATRDVAHAKLRANRAAKSAAKAALQVHGAIGYTEECNLVIWLRRTWSMVTSFGTDDAQRARIASSISRAPDVRDRGTADDRNA